MKMLLTGTYYFLIACVCAIGIMLVGSMLPFPGNIALKIVKSGSMEPAIPVGSVIIIKPAAAYKLDDVVTFGADTKTQIPTTHRIIGIDGQGAATTFTVKGDANNAPDPIAVKFADVHGKVFFSIPYLGYILAFAKSKLGFLLLVGIPALVVCFEEAYKIYVETRRLLREKREARPRSDRTYNNSAIHPRAEDSSKSGPSMLDLRQRHLDLTNRSLAGYSVNTYYRSLGALAVIAITSVGVFHKTVNGTIAYYASREVAVGNRLQASDNFPSNQPVVKPNLQQFSALSAPDDTPPQDDPSADAPSADDPPADQTPPQDGVPPATFTQSLADIDPPADNPEDITPPDTPPAEGQSAEVPPAETPPVDPAPTE